MNDEKFVVLDEATEIDEHELTSGRCRIYNSSKDRIGCKNVSSESKCQEYARSKGAYGYGWAPGYSC